MEQLLRKPRPAEDDLDSILQGRQRESGSESDGEEESIQHLTRTILSIDHPRKITGTLIQDPSKGKIPEFKFIKMFSTQTQNHHSSESQSQSHWFSWIDLQLDRIDIHSIPNDLQQAQQWSLNPPTLHHPVIPSQNLTLHTSKSVKTQVLEPELEFQNLDLGELGQSSCGRPGSISAGVRLSDFNSAASQLEMKELEDINKFITADVFGSQSLL